MSSKHKKKRMSTPTKRWPNEAEWARMDSIAMSIRARNCIKMAMLDIHDEKTFRNNIIEAIECMHEIETKLLMARNGLKMEEKE